MKRSDILSELTALGPLDGRYRNTGAKLAPYFSEYGLMKARLQMQTAYLQTLSEHPGIPLREFTPSERQYLNDKAAFFSPEDALMIPRIEKYGIEHYGLKATNHDVVALIEWIKLCLKETSLADVASWVHFGLTSEDCNNIAYALMLRGGIREVLAPEMLTLINRIDNFTESYPALPMLALTHGQAAVPTTLGKEFNVFSMRLRRQFEQLQDFRMLVKLNGASGNYCALAAAFPDIDWIEFSERFIESLNDDDTKALCFDPNLVTTQIEPHDTYAELFDIIKRFNTVLIDFDQDGWHYISDEWLVQKPVAGEVGSSAMPQKVNPINLENSEGNLGVANALFEFFCRKLPISRRQRDLSDSTVIRNFGVALGHSLLGYENAIKGLSKISVNESKIAEDLEACPEVIAEAYQTILRREGLSDAYNMLKDISRGKKLTLKDFRVFVESLDIPPSVKTELLAITPSNYIGLAEKLSLLV